MNKKLTIAVIAVLIIGNLGFLRIWTQNSVFGSQKINSYEYFLDCWQGDVRTCDYDPF